MITKEFIESFKAPIPTEMMTRLNAYMLTLEPCKSSLVASCAKYLAEHNTIQALLHVQYALNEKEVLLRSPDNDGLEKEMQNLFNDGDEKKP